MALRKILDSAEHPSSCSSACQVWRFVLPSWALHRILGLQQGLNLLRMQQAWTGHVTQIMIWPLDSKKSKCWQCRNMLEPQEHSQNRNLFWLLKTARSTWKLGSARPGSTSTSCEAKNGWKAPLWSLVPSWPGWSELTRIDLNWNLFSLGKSGKATTYPTWWGSPRWGTSLERLWSQRDDTKKTWQTLVSLVSQSG